MSEKLYNQLKKQFLASFIEVDPLKDVVEEKSIYCSEATQVLFKPIAINNNGIIAGSNNKGKAALWIRGILVDLSDEMRLERDFSNELNRVGEIYDINNSNQIICLGQSRKGACVVFISSSELDSL